MEILKRDANGVIALLDINKLHDHEEINEEILRELTEEIKRDNELKYPIIVDKYSNVVLDGHHRFFALKNMGCKQISAFVIDYYNPNIIVESWNPVVKSQKEAKGIFKRLGNEGFKIEEVESEKILKKLVEAGQGIIGILLGNEKEEYFIVKGKNKTYKDAMDCVYSALETEGFRKKLDYVNENEAEVLLKTKKVSMAIIIPKVTKEKVVETGTKKDPFPPKTTRHLLPEKIHYPVSLSTLMKESTENESI